jgi:Zn finger protein HypA/HybF involved in hydrogenase expression
MGADKHEHRLAEAYNRMLERVEGTLTELGRDTGPALKHAIERAQETAVELGELTREEAERVAHYLRRDLHYAGKFLADSGKDLGDWLLFDAGLVERSLAELFIQVADRTTVELDRLALEAEAFGEWHSGEVTGPGTFECKSCGERMVIHRTAHISPCKRCGGTAFRRISLRD